jgi:hypothetical protein
LGSTYSKIAAYMHLHHLSGPLTNERRGHVNTSRAPEQAQRTITIYLYFFGVTAQDPQVRVLPLHGQARLYLRRTEQLLGMQLGAHHPDGPPHVVTVQRWR